MRYRPGFPLVALALLSLLTGCAGGGSQIPVGVPAASASRTALSISGPVPPTLHSFDPAQTDPAITAYRSPTLAFAPISPNNGSLLVFLPGQEAVPSDYTTLSSYAAAIGYHVLTIDYPNTYGPGTYCSGDPSCDGGVLFSKWDGRAGVDNVTTGNSVKNRIVKAIQYLAATYPSEGWGGFFVSGEVTWWNVTLAGHSLGSFEAAAIAKIVRVKRVALFAGPEDQEDGVNATWLTQYSDTPASVEYVFAHVADGFYPAIVANATALGLGAFGGWISVDSNLPTYGGSHELSTDLPSADPHHAVAFDGGIPLDANGVPIYEPAWRYMLYPE